MKSLGVEEFYERVGFKEFELITWQSCREFGKQRETEFSTDTPYKKSSEQAIQRLLRHGAVGGIRTLEPLSGYTISSRARYDHFDTTACTTVLVKRDSRTYYTSF